MSPEARVDITASSEPKCAVILLAIRSLTPGIEDNTMRNIVCQGLKRMTLGERRTLPFHRPSKHRKILRMTP